jgi:hypothetical protein
VAAAFFKKVGKVSLSMQGCDWHVVAPTLLISAMLKYKSLNGMQNLTFPEMAKQLRRALAVSMGGVEQTLAAGDVKLLSVKYGLITDNAKVVNDRVDTQGLTRRYGMSAALVRLTLTWLGGIAPRPRSGDGFEQTMCDFLYVQLLAGSTGNYIAPAVIESPQAAARQPLKDPLQGLKDALRGLAKDASRAVVMELTKRVTSIDDAGTQLCAQLEQRMNAFEDRATSKPPKFVAVARNAPQAEAADLFVVCGTLTCDGSAWRATPDTACAVQALHVNDALSV